MGNRHPWLGELIAQQHSCCTGYTANCSFPTCNGSERFQITDDKAVRLSHFEIEAILLIANATKQFYEQNCDSAQNSGDHCKVQIDGAKLFKILQHTTIQTSIANFSGFVARDANYPSKRNGPADYSVFQLRLDNSSSNGFQWYSLGNYEGTQEISQAAMQWNHFLGPKPEIYSNIQRSVSKCMPSCTDMEFCKPGYFCEFRGYLLWKSIYNVYLTENIYIPNEKSFKSGKYPATKTSKLAWWWKFLAAKIFWFTVYAKQHRSQQMLRMHASKVGHFDIEFVATDSWHGSCCCNYYNSNNCRCDSLLHETWQ